MERCRQPLITSPIITWHPTWHPHIPAFDTHRHLAIFKILVNQVKSRLFKPSSPIEVRCVKKMEEQKNTVVYMCGYLPGVSPEKSPILTPVPVHFGTHESDTWKDVWGGGCGFAMALSGNGKLVTWGSADDDGQTYLTSGRHGETPEVFPLPSDASVVKAAAGWSHCVLATDTGEVYSWGWKECVPTGKTTSDPVSEQNNHVKQNGVLAEHVSHTDNKKNGEEIVKRRKVSAPKEACESPPSGEDFFTASPSLTTLGHGVKITSVAAGGRHSLALSDMGQVWGWGYGGEGQLGLGTRIKKVSSPQLIPCTELSASRNDRSLVVHQGSMSSTAKVAKYPGSCVKEIACGGRHSAVITDAGALLTFGWGLYGQCGQGNTNDQLRPTFVSSLKGIQVERIAAGLWHTVCVTVDGNVYAFGGNQFGQLGTGADQLETRPRLLDAPSLESKQAKRVSCGARHSAVLTEEGEVFSWGWNKYGQLGLGDAIDRSTPSQVPIDGCQPKNVSCGWWHTLLLGEAPT